MAWAHGNVIGRSEAFQAFDNALQTLISYILTGSASIADQYISLYGSRHAEPMKGISMDPSTALNFVPSADVSYNALNSLIGAGWDTILTGGNPTGAGGVLLSIMAAFNAVGIAVAAIMVFYQIHAGVIDTAHQGEALGKNRSTLWVPLRIAGGIAMMMPLPWCQASLLQALILKFVFLSIAGADFINTQVTNQMVANGGHITSPAQPDKINDVTTYLLEGLTIQTFFNVGMDMPSVQGLTAVAVPNGQSYLLWLSAPDPALNGSMGYIEVPCSLGQNDPVCKARVSAIQAMLPNLQTAANAITSHWQYGANQYPDPNSMISAMSGYQSTVQSAMVSWIQSQQPTEDTAITLFAQVAQNQGWASVGSWYWTVAHFNDAVLKVGTASPVVGAGPDYEKIGSHATSDMTVSIGQLKKYLKQVSIITTTSGSVNMASVHGNSAGLLNKIFPSSVFANLSATAINAMSEGDPVSNMQSVGQSLVAAAVVGTMGGATAYGVIRAGAGVADGIKSSLLGLVGAGAVVKGPAEGAVGAADFMMEIYHELLSACFLIGLLLANYLPAIPFITWTLGLIGWMILVMEAIFAAPVWATAHALPDGEGFIGQSARRGYMLLLNILLRPSLMTTGFYISFMMMPVVGAFIGSGFKVFVSGLMSNSPTSTMVMDTVTLGFGGIISGLATLVVGGILLSQAEHQVFSLITWLPENIMRWIEGQMGGLGEHERENKIQGLVMANFGRSEAVSRATRRGPRRKPGGGGEFKGG
ncbi:DotA/TraY family protein [Candidatus Methylospira mobilis]|uniref:DotA/TraY family protein n=1 Tax=Candidatus Methylospira mobilis TaxID=1808979 RepID=UPI0028E6420F|nr:DotA/TraY family protein [Candidatus Methylospira mobilis]WNV05887.1 DotA/TraY family protein [Candidatus Methylospira mobilis]